MSKSASRTALVAIVVAFVGLSTFYSIIVPPFEASDELWHFPMVKYIADNWSLPVQDPVNVGPWRQEGSQPPLYYVVTALVTSWIDTSDMPAVRHLNPHVDNGVATPDGNINLVVHRRDREDLPWRGTILAVHVARFVSIGMAAVGVCLTYLVVRTAVPRSRWLAVGATALHAFTPMVVFIAGSVNNDNLVVPLSSLALLFLLRLLRKPETGSPVTLRETAGRYLLLGAVLGLAALTKASSLALTVLTALVVAVRALRRRREGRAQAWKEFLLGGFATVLPLLAISGWWYVRNIRLYGDPTGLNAFIAILGQREVPAGPTQLWRERYSFLTSYWGNFGGLNVPMSPWVYRILNTFLIVSGVGLLVTVTRCLLQGRSAQSSDVQRPAVGRGTRSAISAVRDSLGTAAVSVCNLQVALSLLWGLGVLIPWVQWARVTWSSQGRLVFAALPVWTMLLATGLGAVSPRRLRTAQRFGLPILVLLLTVFLLGLSVAAPLAWIRPAYARPQPLTRAQIQAIPDRTEVRFGSTLRLLGHDLKTDTTRPGGNVKVTLYWEAIAPTEEDHTVFVHLLDDHDLVVAQRDTFPGLGLLSTTWLDPGYRWADRYVLPVPATAYAPNEAQIEVGLSNTASGERLTAFGSGANAHGDNLRFGRVLIQSRPGDVPNPVRVNFGGRMMLTGYDISDRVIGPGETVTLTLYWEALRGMRENYTVSAQVIDRHQRKAAQRDSWPVDGAAPTSAWRPGDTFEDRIPLAVAPDAPAGPFHVRLAVYVHGDEGIRHLAVTPPDGRMQGNHVTLSRVRIGR